MSSKRPVKRRKINDEGNHIVTSFDFMTSTSWSSWIDGSGGARPQWQPLMDQPGIGPTWSLRPAVINDKEYMVVNKRDNLLYTYNRVRNGWIPFPNLQSDIPPGTTAITYDRDCHSLYIIAERRGLFALDIRTGVIRTLTDFVYLQEGAYNLLAIPNGQKGDIHVFANDNAGASHLILEQEKNYLSTFKDLFSVGNCYMSSMSSAIYCKERDSIIAFGEEWLPIDPEKIEDESISERTVALFTELPMRNIPFIKKLKERDSNAERDPEIPYVLWTELQFQDCPGQAHGDAGFVCVEHGRYLITFGGRAHPLTPEEEELNQKVNGENDMLWWGIDTDAIVVYDTESEEKYPAPAISPIRCPAKGQFHALVMRDDARGELLTFGFINRLFRNELKGTQTIPIYLIQLMAKWVERQAVHLLQGKGYGHWKMSLDHILGSV